jgi:hypothetical protein
MSDPGSGAAGIGSAPPPYASMPSGMSCSACAIGPHDANRLLKRNYAVIGVQGTPDLKEAISSGEAANEEGAAFDPLRTLALRWQNDQTSGSTMRL